MYWQAFVPWHWTCYVTKIYLPLTPMLMESLSPSVVAWLRFAGMRAGKLHAINALIMTLFSTNCDIPLIFRCISNHRQSLVAWHWTCYVTKIYLPLTPRLMESLSPSVVAWRRFAGMRAGKLHAINALIMTLFLTNCDIPLIFRCISNHRKVFSFKLSSNAPPYDQHS